MNPVQEFAHQVGERLRQAREEKKLSQADVATSLGFNDRQTISAMETGVRQVQSDELLQLSRLLNKSLAYFTDPYVVTDSHGFSYRAKASAKEIGDFENKAHKLISAHRRFGQLLDETAAPIVNRLTQVQRQSTFSVATRSGEQLSKALQLGSVPAQNLPQAIDNNLKTVLLFVDAPKDISGAACHLPDGDFILINRNEVSFRRNYNLAHELFHILTWDQMPPQRLDPEVEEKDKAKPRVEKLADAFAAGLLMPSDTIRDLWQCRRPGEEIHTALLTLAKTLCVSGLAVYWRLVNERLLERSEQSSVDTQQLGRANDEDMAARPPLFNAKFVRRLHTVLSRGYLSARKAADLLDCDVEQLPQICAPYGLNNPLIT